MHITPGMRLAGLAAVGIGIAATLSACTGGSKLPKPDGPFKDETLGFMSTLKPGGNGRSLSLADDSRYAARGESGAISGVYDGTRMLAAADSHAYGTPTITVPTADVKGDGTATFNELRHVVAHFDADTSGSLDFRELRALQIEVGIRWIPQD